MRERVQKGAAARSAPQAGSSGKALQQQSVRHVAAPRWSAALLDGRFEREADRTAAETGSGSRARRTPLPISAAPREAGGEAAAMPPSLGQTLAQGGAPMQPALRLDMEQRFGHDFSDVRVHTGAAADQSARDLNAHAYTVGPHVVFGVGRFAPDSDDGRRLLAHELAHVVQQQAGGTAVVMREAASPEQTLYDRIKWKVYHAIIAAFKKSKNVSMSAMRSQLLRLPASMQTAVGSVLDVVDFVTDMVIALMLVLIGMAVGFAEGIVKLVYGLIQLLVGLIKLIGDWVLSLIGKPDAYMKDVNDLVKAISGIPAGLKQTIDNWVERYKKASLEDQVLMGGELLGEIEAFIATFALAGTKAGQATTLTFKGGGTAASVTKGGVLALQEASAVAVTIPAVVPKTLAEAAVVGAQMSALGPGAGGNGIPAAAGGGHGSGDGNKAADKPKPDEMKVKESEVPQDTHRPPDIKEAPTVDPKSTPAGATTATAATESGNLANLTLSRRHFLGSLTIPKAAGNSLFLGPRAAALEDLAEIQMGTAKRSGELFKTSSGRVWSTHGGSIHPVSGPDIVNITSREYNILLQAQKSGADKAMLTLENLAEKRLLTPEQVTKTKDLIDKMRSIQGD